MKANYIGDEHTMSLSDKPAEFTIDCMGGFDCIVAYEDRKFKLYLGDVHANEDTMEVHVQPTEAPELAHSQTVRMQGESHE